MPTPNSTDAIISYIETHSEKNVVNYPVLWSALLSLASPQQSKTTQNLTSQQTERLKKLKPVLALLLVWQQFYLTEDKKALSEFAIYSGYEDEVLEQIQEPFINLLNETLEKENIVSADDDEETQARKKKEAEQRYKAAAIAIREHWIKQKYSYHAGTIIAVLTSLLSGSAMGFSFHNSLLKGLNIPFTDLIVTATGLSALAPAILIGAASAWAAWCIYKKMVPNTLATHVFSRQSFLYGLTHYFDQEAKAMTELSTTKKAILASNFILFILPLSFAYAALIFDEIQTATFLGPYAIPLALFAAAFITISFATITLKAFLVILHNNNLKEALMRPFQAIKNVIDDIFKDSESKHTSRASKAVCYALVTLIMLTTLLFCGLVLYGLYAINVAEADGLSHFFQRVTHASTQLAKKLANIIALGFALVGDSIFAIQQATEALGKLLTLGKNDASITEEKSITELCKQDWVTYKEKVQANWQEKFYAYAITYAVLYPIAKFIQLVIAVMILPLHAIGMATLAAPDVRANIKGHTAQNIAISSVGFHELSDALGGEGVQLFFNKVTDSETQCNPDVTPTPRGCAPST